MALAKTITLASGATITYHRFSDSHHFPKAAVPKLVLRLLSYASKDYRDSAPDQPLRQADLVLTGSDYQTYVGTADAVFTANEFAAGYAALAAGKGAMTSGDALTAADFAGATDI